MQEIIVVDSDSDLRDALQWAFEDSHYLVSTYDSESAALTYLYQCPHSLIVLFEYAWPLYPRGQLLLNTIANDTTLHQKHAYLLMSALRSSDKEFAALLQSLEIPLILKPFELEILLQLMAQVAAHVKDKELTIPRPLLDRSHPDRTLSDDLSSRVSREGQ